MPESTTSIVLVGAAGKMGMRISANLEKSDFEVHYCETSKSGVEALAALNRKVESSGDVVPAADVVILAVPDRVLGAVAEGVLPLMKEGSILLTLDPAVAYAGLIPSREGVALAVSHPCHPSLFLVRDDVAQFEDVFGGVSAPQFAVAAVEPDDPALRARVADIVKVIYAPVVDVVWVTVKQMAYLEPTLVEVVASMVATLVKEALDETVNTVGVPREAAEAMLFGHVQVAMNIALRATNPFSDACLTAIEYGKREIIKDDWKKIFTDAELDRVVAQMLEIESVNR